MRIGFIGLGNMGAPMAHNLARAGHTVLGFDTQNLTVEMVEVVQTARDCAQSAEVVITMLPNGKILKSVADETIQYMREGSIFLDCSTVDVASAKSVAEIAKTHKIIPLDAPVSGGIGGAKEGTLTFMVGGPDEGFIRARELFNIMGQKAVHCGASGNGQSAKICNNMILGATMIATCEAFALADKLSLDRQAMFDVVSTSSGYSWSMNAYCPAPGIGPKTPSDNNYIPGFSSDLMLKDLTLSQVAAEDVNADTPMGYLAMKLFKTFVEEEDGSGKDFSAMLPRFEKKPRN
ncbi:3-hydroxyisobutyrate dehydrogenase [Paracoccaceae bacterium]|nr:3-hydroxyisobutyrate dehydrogenase [Paracoccaceae bacterium]|tara:strand:- start:271 stop:1143 length:873 start_codon:yes stop_codon:yes gene_type:complete